MKAAEVRRLANGFGVPELAAAAEGITEREEDPAWVDGADVGEKLTHLMLAMRIRERTDGGEDPKEAFRAELSSVRALLANE